MGKKIRHHYVPQAYLRQFCDQGKIWLYKKGEKTPPKKVSIRDVGLRKYYYSQQLSDGARDDDLFEELFSKYEARWPPLVKKILNYEDINDSIELIREFIALQRVRVPASRDVIEQVEAHRLKFLLNKLDAQGDIYPKPVGYEDIVSMIEFSINKEFSLHSMPRLINSIYKLFDHVSVAILKNKSELPFLTSDNPVVWFDPSVKEEYLRPYHWKPDGNVIFFFPISPRFLIMGDNSNREQFIKSGILEGVIESCDVVEHINRKICQFAYKAVYASDDSQASMINEYYSIYPAVEEKEIHLEEGHIIIYSYIFMDNSSK